MPTDLLDYSASAATAGSRPLAERMRPVSLAEFEGQRPVVGPEGLVRRALESDHLFSMILWGPPGCGKTTLARIMARETRSHFVQFSAVLSGVKEIRQVIAEAREQLRLNHRRTLLFVDEIHRFNKAQQDAFLQHVEQGLITLIGATTENPSFEVIPALLSRCRVVTLDPLTPEEITAVCGRALADRDRGLGRLGLRVSPEAMDHLARIADGDVRTALNALEIAAGLAGPPAKGDGGQTEIALAAIESALQHKALQYDKAGESHFNLISALHKSLRGSDPDGALYWLGRMLAAGEDPLYVGRRMVRFASEDIGNADPYALRVALDAVEAYRFLGSPEGDLALAQAAAYLATAPKSNAVYTAYGRVLETVKTGGSQPVPLHIRNAPTRLMKDLGYGEGYRYAHDHKEGFVAQEYLPESLIGRVFYRPTDRGYEKTIKQRLDRWRELQRKARRRGKAGPE
jgi:putative ATPase